MRRFILPIIVLFAAAGIQGNIPSWMTVAGAKPDFILIALIASALTLDPPSGAVLGFAAGLIHGAVVGESLGSFIASRTIIGFLAGMVTIRLFSENPLVPVLAAGGLTFIGEGLFMLANPKSDLAGSIISILITSLFNAVLTLAAFWLIKSFEVRSKIKRASARL
jgi:rod shape-determining protein MreD